MASKVENNKVFLTRGDSFDSTVALKYKDGTSYLNLLFCSILW